jgi:hypothetical protein
VKSTRRSRCGSGIRWCCSSTSAASATQRTELQKEALYWTLWGWVCCLLRFIPTNSLMAAVGNQPTKLQLLFLDFLIMCLQIVLVTIAYETSFSKEHPSNPDVLLPAPTNSAITKATPGSSRPSASRSAQLEDMLPLIRESNTSDSFDFPNEEVISPYIIDLRFSVIMSRLRHPPSPASSDVNRESLPMPNTTPHFDPSRPIGWLLRARATREEMRARTESRARESRRNRSHTSADRTSNAAQPVLPGAID